MLLVKPSESDSTIISIKAEYATKLVEYPLLGSMEVPVGVYVTQQQYIFWRDVSSYLPYGAFLKKAYVRPDDHALNGLIQLETLNPSFNFDSITAKRTSSSSSPSNGNSANFFSNKFTPNTTKASNSDINKTHPNLNGKFKSYYLHQFDYDSLKSELLKVGVTWSLPFDDSYQKGLLMVISLENTTIDKSQVSTLINSIITQNIYLNASKCTLSGTDLTIEFKSGEVSIKPYEFGILNVGPNNNVADCFSERTLQTIYNNLKINGYGDLDEVVKPAALKGFPLKTRKKGTALAKAIRDSLIDVLGGSEGIVSVLQGSTNEYLMALINGLIASNNVLYDELDRLGGGNVKKKAQEAFESGMNRAVVSKNVLSLLNNGREINQNTGKSLLSVEDSNVVKSNAAGIQTELELSRKIDIEAGT
ncbi:MAG: hypothetical protein WC358_01950 [Ignavibacteria bacterium]|jgi:hypothetical protein